MVRVVEMPFFELQVKMKRSRLREQGGGDRLGGHALGEIIRVSIEGMDPKLFRRGRAVNRKQVEHFDAATLQRLHDGFMATSQGVVAVGVDEHREDGDEEAFVGQFLTIPHSFDGAPGCFEAAGVFRGVVEVQVELERPPLNFPRLPSPKRDVDGAQPP